jgi:hypothetical protein
MELRLYNQVEIFKCKMSPGVELTVCAECPSHHSSLENDRFEHVAGVNWSRRSFALMMLLAFILLVMKFYIKKHQV